MKGLSIRLLGSPRVECDGVPIEVDTRKAIALLAYLAVGESAPGRDRLAGLLWPDYAPDRARGSLRRTLSTLLKALGGRWVVADRRTVWLERDGVWVDVDRFAELLRQARGADGDRRDALGEAVSLYRGDFLAGFALRDSPEFDDWQFFTAEGLRRDLAEALEGLAQDCSAAGELRSALAHAHRWLALDPLHEPAHRTLMTLYAWADQRTAALRQYRECVKVLDRELGVAPLEETHELYRTIKEQRLPPPAQPAGRQPVVVPTPETTGEPVSAQTGPPAAETPLVGRDRDLKALTDGYRAAERGWLAVVEGETGIGKSRLLAELAATARAGGGTVIVTGCFDGEQHLPYGPFVAALRALVADTAAGQRMRDVPAAWWTETARVLPELATGTPREPPAPADGAGAQARLLDALTGVVLAGLAGEPPGLLVVDDVHWADSASLALIAYLVRRLAGTPVAIALAWRAEAVPPSHPLRRLGAEPPVPTTRLRLGRLTRPEVDRLLDAGAPDVAAGTRARLWEETEGVPLFIVEYLAALGSGADVEQWTVASGVRDLVAARLDTVDEAARQLLTTAAVIGRSFRFTTLRDASGRGEEETVAGLDELLASGLLREESGEGGEPVYDFTHHQVQAQVLAGTSLARRRLLHRRIAGALEEQARGRRGTAALRAQIAWHLQQAGEDEAAAVQYARAGDEARGVYANAEARSHYEAALALGHPDEAGLHAAVGDLCTLAGRYDEAVQRYETAAAVAPSERLAALEHRLGAVHQRLGDWELAEDHFRAALGLLDVDGPPGPRARILADASLTAHRRGEAHEARALAEQALALAAEAQDPPALAQAHNLLGMLATARGDTAVAVDHLERSLALATDIDDPVARAGALNNLALAHRTAGAIDCALPLAEEAVRVARQVDDRHRLAAATGNLADLLRDSGRLREAEARVREAVEILAGISGDEPRPEVWKLTEW